MSVSEIPEKVRALLWAKSAGRCEFDNCNEPLWRDSVTQIEMNFAEVAHIIGDRPNGPRGNQILSQEYCNDESLCTSPQRRRDFIPHAWVYTA